MADHDPGELHGLIALLGLSQAEAAQIIGISHTTLSRKLAAEPRYEVRDTDVAPLQSFATAINAMIDRATTLVRKALAQPPEPPQFPVAEDWANAPDRIALLVYRKDEDVPPEIGIPFASAHRTAMARIAHELKNDADVRLIAFNRAVYDNWRGSRPDTTDMRGSWARSEVLPRILGLDVQLDGSGHGLIRIDDPSFVVPKPAD